MNPMGSNRGRPPPTPFPGEPMQQLERGVAKAGRSDVAGTNRIQKPRSKGVPSVQNNAQDILSDQARASSFARIKSSTGQIGMQSPSGASTPIKKFAVDFNQDTHAPDSVHLLVPITSGIRGTLSDLKWPNPRSLKKHFSDHAAEFTSVTSKSDYLAEAKAFWSKPILAPKTDGLADLLEKRGSKGPQSDPDEVNFHKLYRFERSTGIISVIRPDPSSSSTLLVTLFKPGYKKPLQARLLAAEAYFDKQ